MKKLILFFIMFLGTTIGYAQNSILPNPIPLPQLSPDGKLDDIYDQYGNKYRLTDLQVGKTNTSKNGTTLKTTLLSCGSSTSMFELYFEDGSGMEDTSDAQNNLRRAVICKVFQDISDFIISPLNDGVNDVAKVKIWVRDIRQITNVPANVNGLCSGFYNMPVNTTPNFGGIVDNEIWKTIHNGVDSYASVTAPLASTDPTHNNYYHGIIAFKFHDTAVQWNTNATSLTTPSNLYDLYTVMLHEVTHALGFESLISINGMSKFGTGLNYYSRYDRYLKTKDENTFLITNTSSPAVSQMYNYRFNSGSGLSTSDLQPGTGSCPSSSDVVDCTKAIKYIGGGTNKVPVFTPHCFTDGSSLSHFEDQCYSALRLPPLPLDLSVLIYPNDEYFVMSNATPMGIQKRFYQPAERQALCDMGYSVKTTFNGHFYTGASICPGINVAGINDGLTSTNYLFIGDAGTGATNGVSISGILANDTVTTTGFEGLQDVNDTTATLTNTGGTPITSGNSSTTFRLKSNVPGIHLLRYVPISGTGSNIIRGNITYIFTYLKDSNTCATPTTCNLVLNGDMEIPSTDVNKQYACAFSRSNAGTPDYFNPTKVGSLQTPCNFAGNQTDRIPLHGGYMGMIIQREYYPGYGMYSEPITTRLTSPLLPNQTYQLSFDVSFAEGFSGSSAAVIKFQAYLQKLFTPPSGNYQTNIVDPTMLFRNPTFSTITDGWERITFAIPARSIAGEEYLYIGGLNNVEFKDINTLCVPGVGGCTYYSCSQSSPPPFTPLSYYYIDNVELIPTYGAVLDIPEVICLNQTVNLNPYLSASTPAGGIFQIDGVAIPGGIYNATTLGIHSISYNYTDNVGCSISISDGIEVKGVTFNPIAPICSGSTAPTLPTSSTNSPPVSGTWSPSTVSNTATGTYTFTPNPGSELCMNPITITVTVNPKITPTFNPIAPICSGSTAPTLPTSSTNSPAITGTWSPATVSNTTTGTYTFTPTAGQCANTKSIQIVVNPKVTPTFNIPPTICSGSTVPTLPTSSTNSPAITGTWSPSDVSNTATGTYTFTPAAGQCANPITITVTVKQIVTPTFNAIAPICSGDTAPVLSTSSTNSPAITGTWSPSAVSNTTTGTYTFTPAAGQCANTATITITVKPKITPTFNPIVPICSGSTAPILPTNSTNSPSIPGTWSPSVVSNTATGTYLFTPNPGQCANTKSIQVVVNPKVTPTFNIATTICTGNTAPTLSTSSTNSPAITGSWSPSVVSNTATGNYTFTPTAGQCANSITITVTVKQIVTPTFNAIAPICSGDTAPVLQTSSTNSPAITGTWSPSVVSNTTPGNYTFTPADGQCANTVTITVTVNPKITPTFNTIAPICSGSIAPTLPTSSTNSPTITGTWSPSVVSNTATGTYIFTPNVGQCANTKSIQIIVNPKVDPVFNTIAPICSGSTAPTLPTSSTNSPAITGTWSPSVVSNTTTGTYTFTPTAGQCANTATIIVTVNSKVIPTFNIITPICYGSTVQILPTSSTNSPSITGSWSPSAISNIATDTYAFTPTVGQCANPTTITITVLPQDDSSCNSTCPPNLVFSTTEGATTATIYKAENTIITQTAYWVDAGQDIEMKAGTSIDMFYDTDIRLGADFLAKIEECDPTDRHSNLTEFQEQIKNSKKDLNKITIFPNPNKGNFTVQFNSSTGKEVHILINDISGRTIFDKKYGNTGDFSQNLQLDNLRAGVYLVTVQNGDRKEVKRIVVE